MRRPRRRVDLLLVERGLAASRSQAQALILAGQVRCGDRRVDKPGQLVEPDAPLEVVRPMPYVSRGGQKLEGALRSFGLRVEGMVALDVGASTGGFTDCLLQHGVRRVWAVDVGRGQLHWRLRRDPRVVVLEGVNARWLTPEQLGGERVDLATVDVSFISLRKVLPAVRRVVRPGGWVLALVKPQFELGPGAAPGGVVRDPEAQRRAVEEVKRAAASLGLEVLGECESPLRGPKGNREWFLWLRRNA